MANWPPRQPDRLSPSPPPALPRLLLAVFGHTLRHLCLFVDSCLILLFFAHPRSRLSVRNLHPAVAVLSSNTQEGFYVFSPSLLAERPPAAEGSLSGQTAPALYLPLSLAHVWMKAIVRYYHTFILKVTIYLKKKKKQQVSLTPCGMKTAESIERL